ncbi:hypothetical protein KFE25_001858 [Diacronema lutheri]|uniref:Uncharacterized protein n=2 Tax=Diacronema lutheri TaxID=2081491 RepID=A0A8J6C943_DIALT|nr:hypothetical protein KFE25_001858 [Diacronema lutheri]
MRALALRRVALFSRQVIVALEPAAVSEAAATFAPRGITAEDTAVFLIGMAPFVWATVEFWRRIAVGEPFGTTSDSVIIRDTSGPDTLPERRRVLGRDAIITARLLFVAVGIALCLVVLAGLQVLGTAGPPVVD